MSPSLWRGHESLRFGLGTGNVIREEGPLLPAVRPPEALGLALPASGAWGGGWHPAGHRCQRRGWLAPQVKGSPIRSSAQRALTPQPSPVPLSGSVSAGWPWEDWGHPDQPRRLLPCTFLHRALDLVNQKLPRRPSLLSQSPPSSLLSGPPRWSTPRSSGPQ